MSPFYVKNVPGWERVVRIGLGGVVALAGFLWLASPWNWLAVVAGIGEAMTGIVGFCPMCALAGRRIARRAKVST